MGQISRFQIILLGVFTFFIIVGVLVFATFKGGGGVTDSPTVEMWGTYPEVLMGEITRGETLKQSGVNINYTEKDPATLDRELVEALSEGRGPDLILLPQALLFKERNKLSVISYDAFPAREFKNTFIEAAEILLQEEGVLGIPFSIDPLVLYWNRTLFSDAGISAPPRFWDEISSLVPKLSQVDNNSNVRRAAIALGAYSNISHAKEIVATLFLQSGNKIVEIFPENGEPQATLKGFDDSTISQAASFYTSFSDPAKANYTWNRSLSNSTRAFSDGTLAMYIGFAGELPDIRRRNPNLNFDVAEMPQARGKSKATFGNLQILAILKQSKYPDYARSAIQAMTNPKVQSLFIEATGLPPTRRDLIGQSTADPYKTIFYDSALSSKVWIDPDPEKSSAIFKDMIDSISSGRAGVSNALGTADAELNDLLQGNN